ncbi:MAG: CDP-diacylglycerol--glycerol-3-phosphate 3-phosphatidyltransferase [Acholeplasmataceae bacterium]|nr:CDP-diacylglycerol--glycerol-3-phosphate 3-phosphatidyltransferase [Acholeplasmataceae bacterium]
MTLANKLTILRVLMIPIMIVFIYLKPLYVPIGFLSMNINHFVFAILFVLAALTDLLDGYIARKYDQITTFGKFLDPIADKILVIVALLYLMLLDPSRVPLWAVMIVIIREFAVTGIRLLAVDKGKVIAASPYGKVKTATTMAALVILLFNDFGLPPLIGNIIFYIAIAFTVISGVDYFIKNKDIVLENV